MREVHIGVAGLLAGAEVDELYLASAKPDGGLAGEGHVGQHELDFVWI